MCYEICLIELYCVGLEANSFARYRSGTKLWHINKECSLSFLTFGFCLIYTCMWSSPFVNTRFTKSFCALFAELLFHQSLLSGLPIVLIDTHARARTLPFPIPPTLLALPPLLVLPPFLPRACCHYRFALRAWHLPWHYPDSSFSFFPVPNPSWRH